MCDAYSARRSKVPHYEAVINLKLCDSRAKKKNGTQQDADTRTDGCSHVYF